MIHELTKSESDGVRPMTARWIVTGEMVLVTAAHFGGDADSTVDMMVLRDRKDGVPLLPGTSLAGALRNHLADVLGGYGSKEDCDVANVFGSAREEKYGGQSPIVVFDSLGNLPENMTVEIRDGVAIDPQSGTAEAHKKFDMEVLPAGTIFPIRVELIVENPNTEPELVNLLVTSLEGFSESEISLGARRSRGLGAIECKKWRAIRYDLTTDKGWISWMVSSAEKPIGNSVQATGSPREAIQAAWPSFSAKSKANCGKRNRVIVKAELQLQGGLLIRSPAVDPDAPDVVHLHSGKRPVLPGTSVAGVFRTHALRIARLVRAGRNDGDKWVDRLFGPRFEGMNPPEGFVVQASRLRISESYITNGKPRRQTRVAIDRFTGGAADTALFDEEVIEGGDLLIRCELRNPKPGELGFVLLLVRDLLDGTIAVGGTSSVGRGFFRGTATLSSNGRTITLKPGEPPTGDDEEYINGEIRKFHDAQLDTHGESDCLHHTEGDES